MPIPALAIPIILGLSKIGSTLISYGLNKSQADKAKAEAKSINRLVESDEDKQFKFDLGMSKNRLNLSRSSAARGFSNAMKSDKLATEAEQYETGKLNTQSVERGVNSLGMKDEDWLYKNKVLSRF